MSLLLAFQGGAPPAEAEEIHKRILLAHPQWLLGSARSSYWIENRLAVNEEPQGELLWPLFTQSIRRAASSVYWLDNKLAVHEAPQGIVLWPTSSLEVYRSNNDKYWLANLLATPEIPAIDLVELRLSLLSQPLTRPTDTRLAYYRFVAVKSGGADLVETNVFAVVLPERPNPLYHTGQAYYRFTAIKSGGADLAGLNIFGVVLPERSNILYPAGRAYYDFTATEPVDEQLLATYFPTFRTRRR